MSEYVIPTERVRLQRDAQGAMCEDCDVVFNITTCPYWHWSKSVHMHRKSGHKMFYYRIALPVHTNT